MIMRLATPAAILISGLLVAGVLALNGRYHVVAGDLSHMSVQILDTWTGHVDDCQWVPGAGGGSVCTQLRPPTDRYSVLP